MSKRAIAAVISILLAAPLQADASAGLSTGFGQIARSLDTHLGSRMWLPFLGLGRFFVRTIHPKGIHDFQLAVFEDHRRGIDPLELEELMRRGVGKGFAPLVRVRSNRSGENVFIYARPRGRNIEMMILVHERDETVLVRIVANAEVVAREFGEPRRVVKLAER
jgi:hypothetical protein